MVRRDQIEYGGTYISVKRWLEYAFDIFAGYHNVIFWIFPDGLSMCPEYDQRFKTFRQRGLIALHRDAIHEQNHTRVALMPAMSRAIVPTSLTGMLMFIAYCLEIGD